MFIAQVPELPGCMSQGETIEEAKENIKDVLEDCLRFLQDEGREIPEPHEYLMGFVLVPRNRGELVEELLQSC
jgi:predicted RNase H-like HicB family nuclease